VHTASWGLQPEPHNEHYSQDKGVPEGMRINTTSLPRWGRPPRATRPHGIYLVLACRAWEHPAGDHREEARWDSISLHNQSTSNVREPSANFTHSSEPEIRHAVDSVRAGVVGTTGVATSSSTSAVALSSLAAEAGGSLRWCRQGWGQGARVASDDATASASASMASPGLRPSRATLEVVRVVAGERTE